MYIRIYMALCDEQIIEKFMDENDLDYYSLMAAIAELIEEEPEKILNHA